MSVFEFPMVFPAGDASLVGRVYRNVDDLVTPQPAVVVTGAWLTVKEIVPTAMNEMLEKGTPEQLARVTEAFLKMKKFAIAQLQDAFDGGSRVEWAG